MASNIDIKDAAGAMQTVKTTQTGDVHVPHHNVDNCALPTGAATAAKQPAIGTAGSASADVITVQGIASGTPQPVSAASLPLPAGAATQTTLATLALETGGNLAAVNTALGAKTDAKNSATDTTSISFMSVFKQISFSIQAAATSLASLVTGTVIAAGTALIGKVAAGIATDAIYSGITALTPKFAVISAASSGDNTLVAAVTSKQIRVLSLFLVAKGTANSIYFRQDTAGTAIFGDATNTIPIDKTGATGPAGFALGNNPTGWMQSGSGKPLVLNLSAAQGVAGGLTYVEV